MPLRERLLPVLAIGTVAAGLPALVESTAGGHAVRIDSRVHFYAVGFTALAAAAACVALSVVGDAAPAFLLVSLRGPLLAFVLPVALGRVVRAVERLPVWAALAAWAVAIGVWHVPAAYDAALAHGTLHDLEHASFVVAGLLVWTQLVDPARRRRLSVAQRLAFAGGLFVLGQLLADVLFLAGPLYPAYGAAADQQLAGLGMMVEQILALGVFAALVLRGAFGSSASRRRPGRLPATA